MEGKRGEGEGQGDFAPGSLGITMRLLQKCVRFHMQPSRFEKFPGGETPDPCLQGKGMGLNESYF